MNDNVISSLLLIINDTGLRISISKTDKADESRCSGVETHLRLARQLRSLFGLVIVCEARLA